MNAHNADGISRQTATRDTGRTTDEWFDKIPAGVLVIGEDNRLLAINARACDILDIDQQLRYDDTDDCTGSSLFEMLPPSQIQVWQMMLSRAWLADDELLVFSHSHKRSGEDIPLNLRFGVDRSEASPSRLFVILEKVTDQSDKEASVNESEKRSIQSEMAKAVSHKLNNVLTVIGNNAALVKQYLHRQNPEQASVCAEKISVQVMKIKAFMENLVKTAQLPQD